MSFATLYITTIRPVSGKEVERVMPDFIERKEWLKAHSAALDL